MYKINNEIKSDIPTCISDIYTLYKKVNEEINLAWILQVSSVSSEIAHTIGEDPR